MNLLLIFILFFATGTDPEAVNEVREMYAKAVVDAKAADSMLESLSEAGKETPLLLAYKASAQALVAKHSLNPYKKLQMLKVSSDTFQKAVNSDPDNVEIRFLRFTVQHYIPEWLGFSGNLEEDKSTIVQNLDYQKRNFDAENCEVIVRFMVESGRCSSNELVKLNHIKIE